MTLARVQLRAWAAQRLWLLGLAMLVVVVEQQPHLALVRFLANASTTALLLRWAELCEMEYLLRLCLSAGSAQHLSLQHPARVREGLAGPVRAMAKGR